jgi:hypothetical protein
LTVTATVTVTASANGCPSSSPVFSSSTFSAATLSSSSTLSSSPAPASSSSSSVNSASSAAPTILQDPATTAGEYDLNGCYIDPADIGYPLVAPFQAADITTVQQCADECADPANGGPYTYAGIEGVQCFCSNATATAPQTPDDCTLPCLGDSTVVCAGDQVVGPSTLRRRGGAGIVVYQVRDLLSLPLLAALTLSEAQFCCFYKYEHVFNKYVQLLPVYTFPLIPHPIRKRLRPCRKVFVTQQRRSSKELEGLQKGSSRFFATEKWFSDGSLCRNHLEQFLS